MKNIKVLEFGRLDKESMEMVTGGSQPGNDCIIAGCKIVSGTNYIYGECAWYTQCGFGYLSCSSKEDYTSCAGGVNDDLWYRRKQKDKPSSGFVLA